MPGSFLVHRLRDQTYWLYLPGPPDPDQPLPLIVMLHGCAQTAVEFAQGTRMNQHAQQQGCAVLYPEQDRHRNSMRCWNWFEPQTLAGRADADLIVRTVQEVTARQVIDPTRIYLVGFSAGAAMAAVLCTTHAPLFAGCAMHSGLMAQVAGNLQQAAQLMRRGADEQALAQSVRQIVTRRADGAHTVPTLAIHGSIDNIVNPINAQQLLGQFRAVASQVTSPGAAPVCSRERWIEDAGRPYRQHDLLSGTTLLLRTILIEGLGHAWSGGDPRHEYFDASGPDATALSLQFLLARRLNGAG
jgi:poly(hydroxyalkanoate) depolymerase family esterase